MSAPKALRRLARELKALKRAGLTQKATLVKIAAGTRTPDNLTAGTNPTATNYACQVIPSDEKLDDVDGTAIQANDLIFILPSEMIAGGQAPTDADLLVVDGVTYSIVGVDGRGANAVYTCLARK